jgi:hypothetical protein
VSQASTVTIAVTLPEDCKFTNERPSLWQLVDNQVGAFVGKRQAWWPLPFVHKIRFLHDSLTCPGGASSSMTI